MKCNNCSRRHCEGEQTIQAAKSCAGYKPPKRSMRMIDQLSNDSLFKTKAIRDLVSAKDHDSLRKANTIYHKMLHVERG